MQTNKTLFFDKNADIIFKKGDYKNAYMAIDLKNVNLDFEITEINHNTHEYNLTATLTDINDNPVPNNIIEFYKEIDDSGCTINLSSSLPQGNQVRILTATVKKNNNPLENILVQFYKINENDEKFIGESITNIEGKALLKYNNDNMIVVAKCDNIVSNNVNIKSNAVVESVALTVNKNILSASHNDVVILTALVTDQDGEAIENQNVTFKRNNITLSTISTNDNGIATYEYSAMGSGDINFSAVANDISSSIITVEDCLLAPPLDGTDKITAWTTMTNRTNNGIFRSHGSYLTAGWSNNNLWELNFDIKPYDKWKYVGPMPICSEEINPYTDAKRTNYAITSWEGLTYFGGLNITSWISQDSLTKITDTANWHHVTITKLSNVRLQITIDETYTAIGDFPNLANLTTLHIGTRDNPSSRNSGGLLDYKNIKVKTIGN